MISNAIPPLSDSSEYTLKIIQEITQKETGIGFIFSAMHVGVPVSVLLKSAQTDQPTGKYRFNVIKLTASSSRKIIMIKEGEILRRTELSTQSKSPYPILKNNTTEDNPLGRRACLIS